MTRWTFSSRLRLLAWLLAPLAAVALGVSLVASPGTPDIQVLDGTTVIALNGSRAFGATPVATPKSKTFTVKNVGTGALLVSEAITVPQGFTLMASFPGVPDTNLSSGSPAFTLAPNATATFTVALNSAVAGNHRGTLSFNTNVTGKKPFTFTVSGKAVPPPSLRLGDDGASGFTFTPGWTQGDANAGDSGAVPFQGSLTYAPAGSGSESVNWAFTGLEPGQYNVAATWVGYSYAAPDAQYTVSDGSTPLGTVTVNQQVDPASFADGASAWQALGTFTVTGSTLNVALTDLASSGYVLADAVRVERVGYPGQLSDDAGPGFSTPVGGWYAGYTEAGAVDFQGGATVTPPTPTPGTPTAVAQWSFTLTPGRYRVMAAYNNYGFAASNAPFSVYDGDTLRTANPVRLNQTVLPNDLQDAGVGWKDIGFYNVTSGNLYVQLSNDANGWVIADAVRVERIDAATTPSTADTVRFLQQASWGATPSLVTQVQGMGLDAWLTQQFTAAETSYPTLPLFKTNNNVKGDYITSCYNDKTANGKMFRTACTRDRYSQYPNQNQFFLNALYGGDQLRQRVAWALHKIWVISGSEVKQSGWMSPYLQILSRDAFVNYWTVMYDVTLNPGMGKYLSMAGSSKTHPNENYPREIMQLFTFGLFELNPDGSQKLDGSGQPIPTYDQTLVDSMTKVFTGWNFAPQVAAGIPNYGEPMRLGGARTETPTNHDFTRKVLLRGHVQAAITGTGTTGTAGVMNAYAQLKDGLNNIYDHPSMAPFVSKQLIQQLVTSNPSAGYVARVADAFNRNRRNANGTLKATQMRLVVRAILLDPEARGDRKSGDSYGKQREPVLFLNNLMRLFDAQSANRSQATDGYLNPTATNLGQNVFNPPSVFSYFSPGKVAVGGNPPVLGPEFQVYNTSTAIARNKFVNTSFTPNSARATDVVRAAGTTPHGTDPGTGLPIVPTGPLGTAVDVSFLVPLASNPSMLADRLSDLMMNGTMSAEMKSTIVTAVSARVRATRSATERILCGVAR
jgi:uncharacterized protein (DUF1800 family)